MRKSQKDTQDTTNQVDELVRRAEQDVQEQNEAEFEGAESENTEVDDVPRKSRRIKLFTNAQICIIGASVFILMMFFAENNNVMYKKELSTRLEERIRERDSLQDAVSRDSVIIERIKSDDSYLEKYAREHYYYRAEDEDVFIVEIDSVDVKNK